MSTLKLRMALQKAVRVRQLARPGRLDAEAAEDRSRERTRRALLASVTAAFNRGIGLITALVSVPLTLKYLEPETYGLWLALSSISAVLTFADLGMGNGLLNAVASSLGCSNAVQMKKAIASAFFSLLAICMVAVAVTAGAVHVFPLAHWLGVHSQTTQAQMYPAIVILGLCFALNLPFDVVQRVQVGLQCSFQSNIWRGAGNLAALLVLLVFLYARLGLPWLTLAVYGVPLAATIANFFIFFCFERHDLMPRLRNFDHWQAGKMIRQGVMFLIAQTGSSMLTAAPVLMTANLLGASEAASTGVAQRLFLIPYALCEFFWAPLWPAYGEAWSRGDYEWIRKTIRKTSVWIVIAMAAMSLPLSCASHFLIHFWTEGHINVQLDLGFATGLLMFVRVARGTLSMPVNGCGFITRSAVLFGCAALLVTNISPLLRGIASPSALVAGIALVELVIVAGMLLDVKTIVRTSTQKTLEARATA